jgi:CxxC motif-containing protein (DUF1111 family)
MELLLLLSLVLSQVPTEAPTGFDDQTNGFTTQEQFLADKSVFEDEEERGVHVNHVSCVDCHLHPVTGGSATNVKELGVGRFANGVFSGLRVVRLGSSDPDTQERIDPAENVRTLRTALMVHGGAYIECISNSTLQANNARSLVAGVRGQLTVVPVLEAPAGSVRFGRFGWKSQLTSLHSFSLTAQAIELDNEQPIDSPRILAMTNFQRSLKAPPRNLAILNDPNVIAGEAIFRGIGCAICHTPTFVTAKAGTVINGGAFTVPEALGSKIIHPFSDFALWNIGTGDGVVHEGQPQNTRNKMRTAPLWGLRTRPLFFHDGRALSLQQVILTHANEATPVTNAFRGLPANQQNQLIAFLLSL